MDYTNSPRTFIGRFVEKTSKAGNQYLTLSLSPEDLVNLDKAKNDKGYVNLMVGKSKKTNLPYLSYTPFTPAPKGPVRDDSFDDVSFGN